MKLCLQFSNLALPHGMPTTYAWVLFAFCWLHYVGRGDGSRRRGRKVIGKHGWRKNREDMFRDWKGEMTEGENRIAFSLIVPTVLIGRERCAFTAPTPKLKIRTDKRTGTRVRAEHESLNNYHTTGRKRVAGTV